MKILIIGMGSMGRRRLKILLARDPDNVIGCVDKSANRLKEVSIDLSVQIFEDHKEAIKVMNPDIAFVCTSPDTHYGIIKDCLINKASVFSEMSLINENHEELINLAKENECKLFFSSTPLYREEIIYINKRVHEQTGRVNYIYHVGQYLPDWHPWESYKDFFVFNTRTNGCREIFCVELPWMIRAFGEITTFNAIKGKITNLEFDYPDSYFVTLEHQNGNQGVVCFDLVSRSPVRKLEVYGENLMLGWDGKPDGLREFDVANKKWESISLYKEVMQDETYSDKIIENMYYNEVDAFFAYLSGEQVIMHTGIEDIKMLNLVDEIEGI